VAGSGSTLIACQQASRRGGLIQLDPRYVDVAILRWAKHFRPEGNSCLHRQPFEEVWWMDMVMAVFGTSPMVGNHRSFTCCSREDSSNATTIKGSDVVKSAGSSLKVAVLTDPDDGQICALA
jgi:hypothetical protein